MTRTACLAALLAFAALTASAQTGNAAAGSVSDLKGVQKVFVDTGDDAATRANIIKELEAAGLGLQIVDQSEGADVVLRFNSEPAPKPERARTFALKRMPPAENNSSAPPEPVSVAGTHSAPKPSTMPAPGTGLIIVSRDDGVRVLDTGIRPTPSEKKEPKVKKGLPAAASKDFAKDFIKLYKTANGVQ